MLYYPHTQRVLAQGRPLRPAGVGGPERETPSGGPSAPYGVQVPPMHGVQVPPMHGVQVPPMHGVQGAKQETTMQPLNNFSQEW